jgi:acetyl esterase/lipase
MKTNFILVAVLGCLSFARAQDNKPFPLWAEGAPGALGTADQDTPTLTPFFPDPSRATGAAMVICPGGGYGGLAFSYEGVDYARFLNEQGIAGFVLKYRLGSAGYRHPVMLQDAARAVRTVRARAEEWKLDKRVGIMGSSAGGHLASTLLTHYDAGKAESADPIERQSSRPDLGILCYPVVTMGRFTHQGSKSNLLGKDPSEELVRNLSNELQVTKDTPPCFIWHTWEDKTVAVENCLQFAQALRQAGVPFDLHIYQGGVHGLGLGSHEWDPAKRHPWTADCIFWLKAQGFAK